MSAKKMKVDERAEEMDLSTQSAPNAVRVSHADITMDVDFGTTTIQGIYIMFLFKINIKVYATQLWDTQQHQTITDAMHVAYCRCATLVCSQAVAYARSKYNMYCF